MIKNITAVLFNINLFIISISFLSAQDNNYLFEHIQPAKSISQTSVTCGLQDKFGYLWFGTQDGLNRYDGYSFKVFRTIPFDSTSLADNWIQCLYEDSKGVLWVGTHSGGISKFNRESETFENVPFDFKKEGHLSSGLVWSISEWNNKILVGHSEGVDCIDRETGQIEKFDFNFENNLRIKDKAVNSILSDSSSIYFGTWGSGLLIFNKQKEKTKIIDIPGGTGFRNINKIKTIVEKGNQLYLGTSSGIVIFDKITEKIDRINFLSYKILNEAVLSLCFDRNNNLWVGTHHNGIYVVDMKKNRYRLFSSEYKNVNSIEDNWVPSIYEDNSGIIWLGTGAGVYKYVPNKQKFNNYNNYTTNGKIGDYEIKSLFQDSKNILWAGSWDNGIYRIDLEKGEIRHILKGDANGLTNNTIWKIYEDRSSNLWFGTYNGLFKYERSTGVFKPVLSPSFRTNLLVYSNVSEIYEDSFGLIWIGTWGNGLFAFNRFTNEFVNYRNDPNDESSISSNLITCVMEDKDKSLWVGTGGNGLNLFKRPQKKFRRFVSSSSDSNTISNNYIKCLYSDDEKYLWIGSWGGGVSRYNKKNKSFKHFTEKEGLSNNMVFGIVPDKSSNLWISTNNGISKLDKKSLRIINYRKEDGLSVNQFSNGYCQLNSGKIAFGGIKGFTIFNPDSIKVNKNIPPIEITSFRVFNKDIAPQRYVNTNEIKLNHNENFFSFSVSALEFTNPQNNYYKYMLEGYDNNWIESGHKREINYTGVSPGKYLLKIRAANSDKVWNNKGVNIPLIITPPFWQSSWFYAFVFIFVMISVIVFYRIRVYNVRKQNEKLELLVKERTAEIRNEIYSHQVTENTLREIVQTRDKFFSIIAHDLRSPFSSILGHAEWLTEDFENFSPEEIKQSLSRIYDGLKKLFKLTEDLLEWSRIQLGKIEFTQDGFNLKDAVEDVISLVHFNAKKKQIKISNIVTEQLKVFADRSMIMTAFQNIVTNAIKFTKESGNVTISARKNGEMAEVWIEDDGVGMSHEVLENLFRIDIRHTTLGTAHEKGTGLGLIISKELIEKNRGTIKVQSEPAQGTKFILTIPIQNGSV